MTSWLLPQTFMGWGNPLAWAIFAFNLIFWGLCYYWINRLMNHMGKIGTKG